MLACSSMVWRVGLKVAKKKEVLNIRWNFQIALKHYELSTMLAFRFS